MAQEAVGFEEPREQEAVPLLVSNLANEIGEVSTAGCGVVAELAGLFAQGQA